MTPQAQKYILPRKVFAIIFYILSLASVVILVKTELRKWFSFNGEPSSANSVIFWGSLILGFLFFFLGNKVWPRKTTNANNKK